MITVTLPNGKTYTFAARNYDRAVSLANKTNGTLSDNGRPMTGRFGRSTYTAPARRCPHGSTVGFCDRGACDE